MIVVPIEALKRLPGSVKRGTRVWICDARCAKAETWRNGWRYFEGVESDENKTSDGTILPIAVCSDACEDVLFERWRDFNRGGTEPGGRRA